VIEELVSNASPKWIHSPAVDLIIGCAGWSLLFVPFVMMLPAAGQQWALGFYTLALFVNFPHYMATIYRGYRTSEEVRRYRFVTVYVTAALVIALVAAHSSYRFVPWLVTLYLTWSPWHYTGQNFGLLMMFLGRNRIKVHRVERNGIWAAFVASYATTFLTFHSAASNDPFFISLGIPVSWSLLRVPFTLLYLLLGGFILGRMIRRAGWRIMAAPVTLYATQFLWFLLPTAVELFRGSRVSQAAYTVSAIAFMHCAQYLWITTYYARREINTERRRWRWQTYCGIVFTGGLALFIPGPWMASYLFGRDFTLSVMAFGAVVNLHHFILDGAIWKLRDPQVRSLLTSEEAPEASGMTTVRATGLRPWRLAAGVAVGLLLMLSGIDQIRYYVGNTQASTTSMGIAATLNPYDSILQTRLGRAYRVSGDRVRMERAFRVAARMDPDNLEAQNSVARLLLETGRYQEAYLHYKDMFANTDPDSEALMNFGALCKQLNRPDEAIDSFQRILGKLPNYAPAHLLLAETLDAGGKGTQAIAEYQRFVKLKSAAPSEPPDLELQNALTRVKQLEAK